MKKITLLVAVGVLGMLFISSTYQKAENKYNFSKGTPAVKSIAALVFGPDGVLFIGDSQSSTVFAVETKDTKKAASAQYDVKNIDVKIAEALGTTKENVSITDMAVNPVSKKLYIAVKNADGTPVLLSLSANNEIKAVSLKDVNFSSTAVNNPPDATKKDRQGKPLSLMSISDMGFEDGKLLISGLCNKEFSSSFRSVSFPFTGKAEEDRKSTRLNSSHSTLSRMPSSA